MEINEIYSATGCEECGNGYKGRVALHEVLLITQEIRDAISNNMPKNQLRTLVYNTDVNTLLQDGLEKVINGYTTFEEVIKLIELDDDIEDNKGTNYKYDLNKALEQTEITKTSQLDVSKVKEQLFKDEAPTEAANNAPVSAPTNTVVQSSPATPVNNVATQANASAPANAVAQNSTATPVNNVAIQTNASAPATAVTQNSTATPVNNVATHTNNTLSKEELLDQTQVLEL